MKLSLALPLSISLALLAALTTAAPTGRYPLQQQFAAVDNLPIPHVAKRSMDVFSPVFSPDRSIFTDKTTSTVRGTPRLEHGTTPKVIWRLPWLEKEPPPSPIPKFWSSVLGPECKDAGPHCPATLASPVSIAERIKGSLAELPVFSSRSKPAITDPATPASKLVDMSGGPLTASELGRKIVAQIEVECPHCGYGTDPRTNKSKWAMFVEWVKKLWENVKLGFTPRPEPEKTGA